MGVIVWGGGSSALRTLLHQEILYCCNDGWESEVDILIPQELWTVCFLMLAKICSQQGEMFLPELTFRCWMNADGFHPYQPIRRLQQGRLSVGNKHSYLFSVMSISLTLVRNVLFGSAPFNEEIVEEDNHMPILPIMTCPKHVLELILLLI